MEKNERLAWRTMPRTYCFSSCPKRHCKRETLPNCKLKKTTFQAPKSCFFIFPSRHSWEQARSFSGAFSSCPERHCKGRPFQLQIKKQLFGLRKVVFSKSLSPRHDLFSPTGSKKTTFRAPKSCFFQKRF